MRVTFLAIMAILPLASNHSEARDQITSLTREESIPSFKVDFQLEIPHPQMFKSMEGRNRISKVLEAVLPGYDKSAHVSACVNTGVALLRKSKQEGAEYPVKTIVPGLPWATLIWEDDNHWRLILDAHWIDFIPIARDGKKGELIHILQPRGKSQSQ
jgi:hypothetical protein